MSLKACNQAREHYASSLPFLPDERIRGIELKRGWAKTFESVVNLGTAKLQNPFVLIHCGSCSFKGIWIDVFHCSDSCSIKPPDVLQMQGNEVSRFFPEPSVRCMQSHPCLPNGSFLGIELERGCEAGSRVLGATEEIQSVCSSCCFTGTLVLLMVNGSTWLKMTCANLHFTAYYKCFIARISAASQRWICFRQVNFVPEFPQRL